ncbi:putative FAD-binding dehydrogenase [Methylobrevis pamukkalensis]|uniref:Putative FAD-binding dehydrogenase n=1 Tax=Methylobrevis pamukkalensis TaxID=1439726 RepID=A0A1E3GZS0_9HYPH|nr:putative FAD-binding dehydrogenase [Methylobrevis pamukkalensis]
MSGAFRLPSGGRIDRSRPVRFTFDGRDCRGFAGDTLASALLAEGRHLIGRSFKYHRPRGFLSAGSDEPNALVGVGRDEAHYTPNLRATQVELYDGLVAESQNRWPSLDLDVGGINNLLAPLLPAGFYYKTFMWPKKAWTSFYEPKIRAAAGLGRSPGAADADRYTQHYAHCEVLVVGGGPAGLAAALAASDSGQRVVLCDEQAEFGGSLLSERQAMIEGLPAAEWAGQAAAELAARANVTLLTRTTAFGYFPHNMIGLCERVTDHLGVADPRLPRERLWQLRAREVVICAGAHERPIVFPDNDRPGILLAEAGRTYVNRYAVQPGTRAVVFTATDSAYRAALDLRAAGIKVAAIADLRPEANGPWPTMARKAGIDVRTGTSVTGTSGRLRIRQAQLAPIRADGSVGTSEPVACDLLLMSGGFTPSVHLFSQSRGKLAWNANLGAYLPDVSVEAERSAGACRGVYGLEAVLADGFAQGAAAARAAGGTTSPVRGLAVKATDCGHDASSARRPTAAIACSPRPSSTGRTTSPPRTSSLPPARASSRSSTSSATRRPAWPPTRARPRT